MKCRWIIHRHKASLLQPIPHLDGVDECHEAQAAEVDVEGVAQRPHQVVPWRTLALRTTHVHHRGACRLAGRLGERGAIRGVVVRVVIHSAWRLLRVTSDGSVREGLGPVVLPVDGCLEENGGIGGGAIPRDLYAPMERVVPGSGQSRSVIMWSVRR